MTLSGRDKAAIRLSKPEDHGTAASAKYFHAVSGHGRSSMRLWLAIETYRE